MVSFPARKEQYIEFVVDSSIINTQRLYRQQFIGNQVFVQKSEQLYGIKNESLKHGRPKNLKNRNGPIIRKIETVPLFGNGPIIRPIILRDKVKKIANLR